MRLEGAHQGGLGDHGAGPQAVAGAARRRFSVLSSSSGQGSVLGSYSA
jgi:hypothetical protein